MGQIAMFSSFTPFLDEFESTMIIRDDQCEEVNNIDEADDPSFLSKKFTWFPGTRPSFCFWHNGDIHSIHVSTFNM